MKSFAGSKAIAVNPNAENQKVAVALALFLGNAESQRSHYELRNIVPCNTDLLADEKIKSDALVVAQNDTFDTTSILQPFVSGMHTYWTPMENFCKSIVSKEVTIDNAETKTEEMNAALNASVVQ